MLLITQSFYNQLFIFPTEVGLRTCNNSVWNINNSVIKDSVNGISRPARKAYKFPIGCAVRATTVSSKGLCSIAAKENLWRGIEQIIHSRKILRGNFLCNPAKSLFSRIRHLKCTQTKNFGSNVSTYSKSCPSLWCWNSVYCLFLVFLVFQEMFAYTFHSFFFFLMESESTVLLSVAR